jgi:uncharacterized protein
MDVTPLVPQGSQIIESYGNGGFRISGIIFTGAMIVFPDRSIEWPGADLDALSVEMLAPIFGVEDPPEILLLGCGRGARLINSTLRAAIRTQGPVLDTGAACRTYNVLMTEERRVVAALLPVD